MGALAVGVLVVLVSSVAFGAAMFGRRPIPQPATAVAEPQPGAVTAPSSSDVADVSPRRRGRGSRSAATEEERVQVSIPTSVKVRSGVTLGFAVLALAALVGVVLSVVVVGVGMLIS